ncbi:MAG: hypothetical protein Q9174_000505 [Haloplaca sp. 1 TL-2023]
MEPKPLFWGLEVSGARMVSADKVVKVPEMAESITEGTLKQWSKQIGDYVEQDEEIATIETDKIDVAVNAPEAGTVKEYLAHEEDTVTVGQDIVKLEIGGSPEGGEKQQASQKPKAPASDKQPTSSDPEPSQTKGRGESKPEPSSPLSPPRQDRNPPQQEKPSPSPEKEAPKQPSQSPKQPESKKSNTRSNDSQADDAPSPHGSRGERRVTDA